MELSYQYHSSIMTQIITVELGYKDVSATAIEILFLRS
ncbi:hypothetical protein T11_14692 [Trichinella zimbabwensis]|uniref:Uncharacterized protein n=1 Tax=Trichinella zimbabwensis TaxID=268475 RepID=A0A0V1G7D6_9BILA|nr:hypothetical protein T11_14692 [Trichinella zimbabwensis]